MNDLNEQIGKPGVDLTQLRAKVDERLAANDRRVQDTRDAITTAKDGQGEATFARVWPRVKKQLDESPDPVTAAREVLTEAGEEVRPILAQEVVAFLSAKGLGDSTITDQVLKGVSEDLASAIDVRTRDIRSAAIVHHNIEQAETGGTHFVAMEEK